MKSFKFARQLADTVFMVRPAHFAYNPETAENNAFQDHRGAEDYEAIRKRAQEEFDQFVKKLRAAGIQVLVGLDDPDVAKPDAVFPNNWISFHRDGSVVTYPMLAESRRIERNEKYIHSIEHTHVIKKRYRLEVYEEQGWFLEGTGSLVLDRVQKIAYACLSPRTDIRLLDEWCTLFGYRKCVFHASDKEDKAIYHTNVMMALGTDFVVLCADTVRLPDERKILFDTLRQSGKRIIEITLEQMYAFAGNMLQLANTDGESFIVMSEQAYRSLRADQILDLERSAKILFSPIYNIERYGGGSVRCMMTEVFLPTRRTVAAQQN